MRSKNKKKKSVVPSKLQIPVAIVLGIAFICLLSARFKGRGTAQGAPVPTVEDGQVTPRVTAADSGRRVQELLDKISRMESQDEREPGWLPDLPVDPFADPYGPPARIAASGPSARQGAQDERSSDEQIRAAFLDGLTLQATLMDGDARLAFIDDTLFAENDTIGAFKIVGIRERAAFLDDGGGIVVLKMKGDDPL
jgi:hypothetical protein